MTICDVTLQFAMEDKTSTVILLLKLLPTFFEANFLGCGIMIVLHANMCGEAAYNVVHSNNSSFRYSYTVNRLSSVTLNVCVFQIWNVSRRITFAILNFTTCMYEY